MPKISRIRIINFSYNGDKRLILDELFNLHQGEDALISLKNGGGKSVLVQALMQPILPNLMLQKRKMSDFFVRKKQPAYILIEWKLDGDGGYLLTGIAMMSKESTFQEQEEGAHAIKYFTFTTSYKLSDAMDIRHIKLTTRDKNRVIVKNYGDAQKLIQEAKKNRTGNASYFSENDKRAYKKHLESFNIHPDEWKTVLLPINSEEGGLIKIFEKCRTPRLLLRDWILNTINKVIFDETEESESLHEMMGNLAQSMIDNESFILERDLLKGFSERLMVLSEAVCQAAGTHAEALEKEQELRGLEQYLHVELKRLEDQTVDTKAQLENERKEKYRIEQEKFSEDYYIAEENYEKSRLKVEALKMEHDTVKDRLEKVLHELLVLEARQIYEEILVQLEKKAELDTELSRLKEPTEDQEMMDRIAYSLKVGYEARYQEIEEKLIKSTNRLEEFLEKKEENGKKLTTLRDTKLKIALDLSKHFSSIDAYEKEEEKLSALIGIVIQRNLMKGLDEKAATSLKDKLKKEVEYAVDELKKTEESSAKAIAEEESLIDELPKVQMGRREKENEMKMHQRELREFEKKEEELLACLNRYDISQAKRFQKEYLLSVFHELKETGQEKLDSCKEEIRSLEKRKSAMENGILHVSKEFYDHLQESGIEFDTGEHYLQKHTLEIRTKLLETIPLLPYAFLMTEEELEKLKNHLPERPLLQPVPVLTYGSLEGNKEEELSIVNIGKGKVILCSPDNKLFESEGIEAYKGELDRRLKEEKESKAHYESYLNELRENEQLINNFHYAETYFRDAKKQEEKLSQELLSLMKRVETLEERRTELKQIKAMLEVQREQQKAGKRQSEEKLQKLEEHLNKNKGYEEHLQIRDELEKEMEKLVKRIFEIEEETKSLGEESLRAQKDKWDQEKEIKAVKEDKKRFENALEKPLEEGSLEELLARYRKYQEKLDGNIERLQKELLSIERILQKEQNKLANKGISEEEYKAVKYLEVEDKRLHFEKNEVMKEVKTKGESLRVVELDTASFSGILKTKREDLKAKGIQVLAREEIHGNYKERTLQCKASINKLEESIKTLEKTTRLYIDIRDKIEDKLMDSKIKVSMKIWPRDIEVEKGFKEVSGELTGISSKLSKEKLDIQQSYWKLKDDFKEKNHHLSSILYTVEKMHDASEKDPENYYYLYEYIENQLEVLRKLIKIQETQLENMERNFHDTVMQSYNLAKEIYDHVNRVADDSSIQLEGKNRKVKMIEILLRELEPEEKGFEAMKLYIRERADEVKEQLKKGKSRKEVQELISKFMSSEELLNVISDLSDLRIKAYKVDINAKHSQAKDWEKVMKENSGGERFVSFFAVMIALMSYARNSQRNTEDYSRKNTDTKVLLMDNPFGPISSDHLLKPLFDIAEKYNTQLICLTDLKQNSIMNQFRVIFMMKIVPNTTGTMEYLKVEESTYTGEEDPVEENLEMLNYYQEEEQISLLDDSFE